MTVLAIALRDKTLPAITCVGFPRLAKNNTSVKLFTFFSEAVRGCLRPAAQQKGEEEEEVGCGFFHPQTSTKSDQRTVTPVIFVALRMAQINSC